MADRIIGFVTVALIAMLTNRVFQIGQRDTLPLLTSAFDAPNINWTREVEPDWLIEPLKYKATVRNYNQSVLASGEYYGINTIDDYKLQDKLLRQDLNKLMGGDAKTSLISINRGKTIRMWENPNHRDKVQRMNVSSDYMFGCITNYLIQPKPSIFLPVYDMFDIMTRKDPTVLKIAIQVRVGDWSWSQKDHTINLNHFQGYFHCAQQIEDFNRARFNYSQIYWYLVSDSPSLRKAVVQRYHGSKHILTATNVTIEHSAKEASVCKGNCSVSDDGFSVAAAEWWLMSFADYFVITRYSGFGRAAGMRSLKKDRIYTVNDPKNPRTSCNEKGFTDLETMSFEWSGI